MDKKKYRAGGLANAAGRVPEKAAAGMAKAAEMSAGRGRSASAPGQNKSEEAMARRGRPAFAKGGYAGKTSTEAKLCKPVAAKAGASFKGK